MDGGGFLLEMCGRDCSLCSAAVKTEYVATLADFQEAGERLRDLVALFSPGCACAHIRGVQREIAFEPLGKAQLVTCL